jgi:hypothetical protein
MTQYASMTDFTYNPEFDKWLFVNGHDIWAGDFDNGFEVIYTDSYNKQHIEYIPFAHKVLVTGASGYTFTSENLQDWVRNNSFGQTAGFIRVFENVVYCGQTSNNMVRSFDVINWEGVANTQYSLDIAQDTNGEFITARGGQYATFSVSYNNGGSFRNYRKNWGQSTDNGIVYIRKDDIFIVCNAMVKLKITVGQSLINLLSGNSDMTMSLEKGENIITANCFKGTVTMSITYRQKYIGV